MNFLRQLIELPRRTLRRIDQAVVSLVSKADEGIVGLVTRLERLFRRMAGVVRRGERRTARTVVQAEHAAAQKVSKAERTVADKASAAERVVARSAKRTEQATVRAGSTLFKQIAGDVTAVVGAAIGTPGRAGRAIESLLAYWATGISRFAKRGTGWIMSPIRNRVASKAKQQALQSVTMTPDHQSHRELLVLLAVGIILTAAGFALFGKDLGARPVTIPFDYLATLPGRVWDKVLAFSPVKLTLLAAALALFGAATMFWVRMLRDSYRREYPTAVERTQWRLVTTLLFIPGAVLYFFKQYNRLTLRKFVTRHVVSVMVTAATLLVSTSTYGTLWYFNQKAEAEVTGNGYQAPTVELDPDDRQRILARDRYGRPLQPATSTRQDPFAPIPGEGEADTKASPSPSPTPAP